MSERSDATIFCVNRTIDTLAAYVEEKFTT